jgi:hypothetical protein
MVKSIVGDWDYTPEDLERQKQSAVEGRKLHEEMKRRGVKTMSYEEVQAFRASQGKPSKSILPPFLKRNKATD